MLNLLDELLLTPQKSQKVKPSKRDSGSKSIYRLFQLIQYIYVRIANDNVQISILERLGGNLLYGCLKLV